MSTNPNSHEFCVSVVVTRWSLEAEHGGELRGVVHHSEAGVPGPGDGGQTPELAISERG